MEKVKKRVGILGGTFDPIHTAHLILARESQEFFQLDEVRLMPAGNPPHKLVRKGRATTDQRIHMIELALKDDPILSLSLMEVDRTGITYTYQTLELLNEEEPETQFYFILGMDSLFQLQNWKEPKKICKSCEFILAMRDHTPTEMVEKQVEYLKTTYDAVIHYLYNANMDISSHMIRERRKEGKFVRYYVPDLVMNYMEEEGIYLHSES